MKRKFDKPIMFYMDQRQAVMLDELIQHFSNNASRASISGIFRLALENLYSQVISQKKEG